ncbi:hypothetical protein AB0K60_16045 [Thermopolyspora sp. NPDC052614]|uniref:hypothetical protein n=1 Tax=Thermopolyspora sp. NPDC052614 TaxID=3155682 RepID=UPI00342E63C4
MADLTSDDTRRTRDALAYACDHLEELREDLGDDPAGSALLDRLLSRIRGNGTIADVLDEIHAALQAAGDALGLYGRVPGHQGDRGIDLAGLGSGPLEIVYLCPIGRCSGHQTQAAGSPPRCGISGEELRRERL